MGIDVSKCSGLSTSQKIDPCKQNEFSSNVVSVDNAKNVVRKSARKIRQLIELVTAMGGDGHSQKLCERQSQGYDHNLTLPSW